MIRELLLSLSLMSASASAMPAPAAIDAEVARAMTELGAKGFALAVIDDGRIGYVQTYGARNAGGDPLTTDTIIYAASTTKAAFADVVLQLVDERKIDLDTTIDHYLAKPLPDYPDDDRYANWSGLKGDERWRRLTPRLLLSHRSGFANFGFLEPDQKLRFHFDPGSRYAYSGDGLILLQFVLETGLGLELGGEMQRRLFTPFGMTRTSMMWRPDFAGNLADGWDATGKPQAHDQRSRPRAAGSMDTTIADMARFAAALVRGDRLSATARAEMVKPQAPINTLSQFPTLQDEAPATKRFNGLYAGLGVVVFEGPQGRGFYKGGHNDATGNVLICLERGKRCVVFLGNDVRMEGAFPRLARFILGETGLPWAWEYADQALLP